MNDERKTKAQLIAELADLRRRVSELETAEAERRPAIEILRADEGRYHSLVENTPLAVIVWDNETRILDWNKRAEEIFGYTREEALGQSFLELIIPSQERGERAAVVSAVLSGGRYQVTRNNNLTRSGQIIVGEWHNSVLHDPHGQLTSVISLGLNITERQQAETHILRLNRLYATLSQINQAIVRARGRAELFHEICRIAVEYGQFRLAWIGWVDEATGLVQPVADAGAEEGYLANIQISVSADAPEGRGPTGTAIREGRCIVSNDTQRDPRMEPWREMTARVGYGSSAAVPIRFQARTVAALSVYVAEPNFFDTEEVKLLEEVGLDISFALDAFEHEEQRRQAEAALRESENRYRELFEAESDAIVLVDNTTTHILEANHAAVVLYGYSRDELLTKRNSDLSAEPEETQRVTHGTPIISDQVVTIPLRYHRKKDGTVFPVEITGRFFIREGQPVHIAAIRDITERKRAEEALRENEEFLRNLLEHAPVSIYVTAADGRVRLVNRRWESDTARQRSDILGCPLDQIFSTETARQFAAGNQKVVEAGVSLAFEEVAEAPVEPHHFFTVRFPLRNALGQVEAVGGISVDITERKQREHELEALVTVAAALRATSTRGEMLPVIVDQAKSLLKAEAASLIMPSPNTNDNVFVLARGAWADWTGTHVPLGQGATDHVLTSGQPIMRGGESILGILWPEQVGEIPPAACVPLIAEGQAMAALWLGRRNDLTDAELRLLMAVADIAANALHRADVVEMLERRVADRTRQLLKANEQLQELDHMKDQFVSNVSHELRTPLANLKLYLSLLDRGKPEKRAEYMETLRREHGRLDKMIEDLLDLSRLDLGVTHIQPVPTDLNLLLSQLIADRAALAAEQQLTLDYQPDDALPLALIDPIVLTEVITNLVGNAINYTPAGGVITVITAAREHAGQTWVTFTVQDNGRGVSALDLPHLFERFYRGEVGRKASAPGTGLGLAISKEIVEKMGGRITVASEPATDGSGAAFTVWLKPVDALE